MKWIAARRSLLILLGCLFFLTGCTPIFYSFTRVDDQPHLFALKIYTDDDLVAAEQACKRIMQFANDHRYTYYEIMSHYVRYEKPMYYKYTVQFFRSPPYRQSYNDYDGPLSEAYNYCLGRYPRKY